MRCLSGMLLVPLMLATVVPAVAQEDPVRSASPGDASRGSTRPQVEHLLRAADHLDAAGFVELARRLRDDAQHVQLGKAGTLLNHKLSELEILRAEVSALRQATGRQQQVLLNVQILEIVREKLRGVDGVELDFKSLINEGESKTVSVSGTGPGHFARTVERDHRILGEIETAMQRGLVNVLAEPNLASIVGRAVHFNSGGEFPILANNDQGAMGIRYHKFGTQVDFFAREMGGQVLDLSVRVRVSELDDKHSVKVGDVSVPSLRVREADVEVEIRAGQTLIIGGLINTQVVEGNRLLRRPDRVETRELIVLATPERVDELPLHDMIEASHGSRR